jgi:hypothetical protein
MTDRDAGAGHETPPRRTGSLKAGSNEARSMEADAAYVDEGLALYDDTQGVLPERLEAFGETYREQGHLTRDQLYDIAYESSTRSAHHVEDNPDDRCRNVTAHVARLEEQQRDGDAPDAANDFAQIALIAALKGFKAPTASCVTAALNPERHAVVDTRVWAALERLGRLEGRKESFDADDYCAMIDEIRDIAASTDRRVVDVGYALFAHDVRDRDGTLH